MIVAFSVTEGEIFPWIRKAIMSYANAGAEEFIIITDETAKTPWLPNLLLLNYKIRFYRVKSFGIGKARDLALRIFANEKNYDCMVLSDAHVLFHGNLKSICNKNKNVQIKIQAWHNPKVWDVGNYYTYKSLKWGFVWDADRELMTIEPVTVWGLKPIEHLVDIQGHAISCWYWGYETPDLSLSLARLGYEIEVRKDVYAEHRYQWQDKVLWNVRSSLRDFCGDYESCIGFGKSVYMYKHYGQKADIPADLKAQIDKFNATAPFSTLDVYQKFLRYTQIGVIRSFSYNPME